MAEYYFASGKPELFVGPLACDFPELFFSDIFSDGQLAIHSERMYFHNTRIRTVFLRCACGCGLPSCTSIWKFFRSVGIYGDVEEKVHEYLGFENVGTQ